MSNAELQRNIQWIVDRVVGLVHPRRIILFGSAAAGKVGPDSDLDFMVEIADHQHADEITDRLNIGVRPRPMPCDFVVVTRSVLRKQRRNPSLIYSEIMDHGREVYAA